MKSLCRAKLITRDKHKESKEMLQDMENKIIDDGGDAINWNACHDNLLQLEELLQEIDNIMKS